MDKSKIADGTTWGNSPCCFDLAKKLNEMGCTKTVDLVNSLINRFTKYLSIVKPLDVKNKQFLVTLIEDHYIMVIDKRKIHDSLKSYIRNILKIQIRKCINNEPTSNDRKRRNK